MERVCESWSMSSIWIRNLLNIWRIHWTCHQLQSTNFDDDRFSFLSIFENAHVQLWISHDQLQFPLLDQVINYLHFLINGCSDVFHRLSWFQHPQVWNFFHFLLFIFISFEMVDKGSIWSLHWVFFFFYIFNVRNMIDHICLTVNPGCVGYKIY